MGAALSALLATTLFFAGDSTLDDHHGKRERDYPYASWGGELAQDLLATNRLANFAKSGASVRSFIADGCWAKLIAGVRRGDFVAIQFGHNDQKRSSEHYVKTRWADPKTTFRDIVRDWVAQIRAKGATPILLSPICRGTFDATGTKLVDTTHASEGVCLGSYRDAMRELAAELGCDFVDMNTLTHDLFERLGERETRKFFVVSTGLVRGRDGEPAQDVTHPVKTGAEAMARLFLDDARRQNLGVARLFRTRDFSIADFGAKPDGSLCTTAFAQAMAAANAAGGGRVIVPKGRWTTGAIRFKSHCDLHLEDGAEVLFTQNPDDYLPAVFTSWEGMECWNYCPLVYACGCTNVAISGTGTLRGFEGNFSKTRWSAWVPPKNGVKAARLQLYTWGATDEPLENRQIWKKENAHTRPHLVQFNRCVGVRWHDFKVRNAPFWTLHLYLCREASVRGLDVIARGRNNDGIDVEMSRNVLIEKCRFDQGDDGIVLKAGRNRDAWRLATPTENVFVRDCEIANAHCLLGIGSELSGGVRNVRLVDCTGGEFQRVVYVKTNRRRGGFVDNVSVDGVTFRKVTRADFMVETNILYEWADFPDYENRQTRIGDISVRNLREIGNERAKGN